jgi:uncharacterized membrane protein YtjA (UPF0391 family)
MLFIDIYQVRAGEPTAKGDGMLYWASVFLVIAIVAAVFGFVGVATAAAGVAKLLFYIFLVMFVLTLIMGLMKKGGAGV